MRIGLFGGSFDPFHNGHKSIIEGALRSGNLDRIVVIPVARNSFKRGKILSAAPYRYYQTLHAIEGFEDKVSISDIEFHMPGISYTANTIRELLQNGYDDDELFWICGSDILDSFDKWREPEELLKMVTLMVAHRPGDDSAENAKEFASKVKLFEEKFATKVVTFDIDGIEVASSAIRADKDFDDVPKAVREFIATHDLYSKDPSPLEKVSDEAINLFYELSIVLMDYLGEKRLLHTINVALYACKIAANNGISCDKALIAGILHDCAKELPDNIQKAYAMLADGEDSKLLSHDKLWHAPAGSHMAKELFEIDDEEILDAIKYHTTGRGNMTSLEKVIYLADKIEPARKFDNLEPIRKASMTDINLAMKLCLDEVSKKFEKTHKRMHDYTYDCYRDLV